MHNFSLDLLSGLKQVVIEGKSLGNYLFDNILGVMERSLNHVLTSPQLHPSPGPQGQ